MKLPGEYKREVDLIKMDMLRIMALLTRLIFSDLENMEDRSKRILSSFLVIDRKNSVCAAISEPMILSFSEIVFLERDASIWEEE
ncbi:MAG: hypothetical protein QXP59_04230 [Saccharolobus sp.]